jgi:hypothetical protein
MAQLCFLVDVEREERELELERVQEVAKHVLEQAVRVWVELVHLVVEYSLQHRWVLGEVVVVHLVRLARFRAQERSYHPPHNPVHLGRS